MNKEVFSYSGLRATNLFDEEVKIIPGNQEVVCPTYHLSVDVAFAFCNSCPKIWNSFTAKIDQRNATYISMKEPLKLGCEVIIPRLRRSFAKCFNSSVYALADHRSGFATRNGMKRNILETFWYSITPKSELTAKYFYQHVGVHSLILFCVRSRHFKVLEFV